MYTTRCATCPPAGAHTTERRHPRTNTLQTGPRAPGPMQAREHRQRPLDRHARTPIQATARSDRHIKADQRLHGNHRRRTTTCSYTGTNPQQTGSQAPRKPGHTGSSELTATTKQTSYRKGTTAGARPNEGTHSPTRGKTGSGHYKGCSQSACNPKTLTFDLVSGLCWHA